MRSKEKGAAVHSSGPRAVENHLTVQQVSDNVRAFTRGANITAEQLRALSAIEAPESRNQQASLFFTTLYAADELINIVHESQELRDRDGSSKCAPVGSGTTKTAGYFASLFAQEDCQIRGPGGIFVRLNPVKERGTGKSGTYVDSDVVAFRYALLEADDLPLEAQISLFACLPLRIVAVTTSGRRSVHAIVRVDRGSLDDYKKLSRALLFRLRVFGIDRSNANPSRFTRLPGALRTLDGLGDKVQRLLYLNANPTGEPIIEGGGSERR